jgi:MFS family permease
VFPRIARALGLDDGSIGEISAAVWAGQELAFAWVSRGVWWQGRALPFAGALAAGIAAMCLLVWGDYRADIVKSLPASMFVNWQAGFAAHAAAAFAAGFALVGIARALTHAASMHYSLSVGRSPEANLGYHEAIIGAAFVLGPLAAGLAADTLGVRAPFAVSAIVGIGALLLVLRRGARLRTAVI